MNEPMTAEQLDAIEANPNEDGECSLCGEPVGNHDPSSGEEESPLCRSCVWDLLRKAGAEVRRLQASEAGATAAVDRLEREAQEWIGCRERAIAAWNEGRDSWEIMKIMRGER